MLTVILSDSVDLCDETCHRRGAVIFASADLALLILHYYIKTVKLSIGVKYVFTPIHYLHISLR